MVKKETREMKKETRGMKKETREMKKETRGMKKEKGFFLSPKDYPESIVPPSPTNKKRKRQRQ